MTHKKHLAKIHITLPRQLDLAMSSLIRKGIYASKTDIICEALRQHKTIQKELANLPDIDITELDTDIDVIMTGKPRTLRDKLQAVLNTLEEFDNAEAERTDLIKKLETKYQINPEEADRLIRQLLREGIIYHQYFDYGVGEPTMRIILKEKSERK